MNGTEFLPPDSLPQQPPRSIEKPDEETAASLPVTRSGPWRLIMQVGHNQHIAHVEIADQITIGRSDAAQSYEADLDLTPFNGRGAGVSRRHVTIYLAHDVLYIRDLGSANGTLLNGAALEQQRLYQLNEGDKITVGKLDVLVFSARPLGSSALPDAHPDPDTTQNAGSPAIPEG